MADGVRFDSAVLVRCSAEVAAAVTRAAAQRRQKPAEWLRRALEAALQRDGVDPLQERQFALVANGELVLGAAKGLPITTFRPMPDSRGEWLPIENEDSAPVDPERHYRLAPLPLRVEGGKVIRTYPVIAKTLGVM